jgi:hypothetical protein
MVAQEATPFIALTRGLWPMGNGLFLVRFCGSRGGLAP